MSNLKSKFIRIKDRLITIGYFTLVVILLIFWLIYEGIAWLIRKVSGKDISIKWDDIDNYDYYD